MNASSNCVSTVRTVATVAYWHYSVIWMHQKHKLRQFKLIHSAVTAKLFRGHAKLILTSVYLFSFFTIRFLF